MVQSFDDQWTEQTQLQAQLELEVSSRASKANPKRRAHYEAQLAKVRRNLDMLRAEAIRSFAAPLFAAKDTPDSRPPGSDGYEPEDPLPLVEARRTTAPTEEPEKSQAVTAVPSVPASVQLTAATKASQSPYFDSYVFGCQQRLVVEASLIIKPTALAAAAVTEEPLKTPAEAVVPSVPATQTKPAALAVAATTEEPFQPATSASPSLPAAQKLTRDEPYIPSLIFAGKFHFIGNPSLAKMGSVPVSRETKSAPTPQPVEQALTCSPVLGETLSLKTSFEAVKSVELSLPKGISSVSSPNGFQILIKEAAKTEELLMSDDTSSASSSDDSSDDGSSDDDLKSSLEAAQTEELPTGEIELLEIPSAPTRPYTYAMTRGRSQRRSAGLGRTTRLSQCAADYLSVLENPFSGKTSCVPTLTNFPTMKHSVRASGTFNTGATPYAGYVLVAPFVAMFNASSINYSQGAYDGTGFWNGTVGEAGAATNSPYLPAYTKEQVSTRLVACGLRVRNVSPALTRGGSLVGLETLGHGDLQGESLTSVLMQDTAQRVAPDGEWHSVVYHPQDDDEYDYLGANQIVGERSNAFLGFVAQAQNVTYAQSYEWEVYVVFEAKGSLVHGLTPSMSDPTGLAAVQNASATVALRKPQTGERDGLVGSLKAAAGAVLTTLMPSTQTVVDYAPFVYQMARGAYQSYYGGRGAVRGGRRRGRGTLQITNAAGREVIPPAFPTWNEDGSCYLYVLEQDTGQRTAQAVGKDIAGHTVRGYAGVLFRRLSEDVVVRRVDPVAFGEHRLVYLDGPAVKGQSLQLAADAYQTGEYIPFSALSGQFSHGEIVSSGKALEKAQFCERHRIILVQPP